MKRLLLSILFLVSLVGLVVGLADLANQLPSAAAQQNPPAPAPQNPKDTAPKNIVYVNRESLVYHRAGCEYLNKNRRAISLDDARVTGYTPCSLCRPPK